MKIMDWESVDESAPFEKLPAGGYVVRITEVEDVTAREYVSLVYEIAEGEHANFYSDDFGQRNTWAHRFIRSYKDNCESMFKTFLARLEDSNRGFSVAEWQRACNVQDFVGLYVGIVLQYEDYTNESGEDKERLNVVGVYSADQIRSNDYKLPERKDSRKGVGASAGMGFAAPGEMPPVSVYDDDLPFD